MILDYPLLAITLIAPLLAALPAFTGKARLAAYLTAATLLIPAVALTAYSMQGAVTEGIVDPLMVDLTGYGIGTLALAVDGLSLVVAIGVSLVTGIVAVYSYRYMYHRIEEMREHGEEPPGLGVYYLLYAGFSATMLGMAYATNLLLFFVFLELSLLTSFALIAFYGYGDRRKISLLYFVWTHIAGALFLAGILYYGISTGSFDVMTVNDGALAYATPTGGYPALAAYLILAGLLVKMAVLGVHMWLPYAHAEAPTPVSALLSPNLIGIAGYAIARFLIPLFPGFLAGISGPLLVLGIATIIYGGLVALAQTDFKRFLAYSSVSQMGYLLLGISTLTAYGIGGAMLHFLSHAFGKAILFMVAGVFIVEMANRDITRMGGLARRYPLMAAAALLGFMNLAGIPPALGLWSEALIVYGIAGYVDFASNSQVLAVALVLIVAFMVTAAYSFVTMRRIFFGPLRAEGPMEVLDEMKTMVIIMAALSVFFFVAVNVVGDPLRAASATLEALAG